MSERVHIYLDAAAGIELILPITPKSYQWDTAIDVNKVAIDGLGELNIPGRPKLAEEVVEGFFPAQDYPFARPGAAAAPQRYVEQLERWCKAGTVLRFLVSGVGLNKPVILERVRWFEQDGTNNVYYRIEQREYAAADTPAVSGSASQSGRTDDTQALSGVSYTVVKGDTLWSLCRRFYGETSMSLCNAVAAVNSIKNPNLIFPGQTIRFPPRAEL